MSCGYLKRSLSLESLSISPSKRIRYDVTDVSDSGAGRTLALKTSMFPDRQLDKLSPNELERNVILEIKGLQRRKQLGIQASSESKSTSILSLKSSIGSEKTVFTFDQVLLICKKMLQEREQEILEIYDAFLQLKLAEQYDAFVKFTHDQIQRNYKTSPSYYLS